LLSVALSQPVVKLFSYFSTNKTLLENWVCCDSLYLP